MSKVKLLYIITKCSKSGPINVLNSIIDNLIEVCLKSI